MNRFKNSIANVRSLRGADIDSDHLLLGIWIKVKHKRIMKIDQRKKARRFDINKLKKPVIRKNFKDYIQNIFQNKQTPLDETIDKEWKQVKETTNNIATKTLGKERLKSRPWFNEICEKIVHRRNLARKQWLNDTNNEDLFARLRIREISAFMDSQKY